ncbi:MAG: MBL fold metallo-hydrolase, partial [Planctomycetia bacterium]|nr:MBL fold metallo-hydrolase [Planctomycetia bacterium]
MMRKLLALAVALVLVGSSFAADAKKITLRWYGQSMFTLETSQGTKVVLDPHAIEAYGRNVFKADLILVSHFHNDHTQVGIVENFQKTKIITGLKGNPKKLEWNLVDEKFKDLKITSVGTYHDDMGGMERGRNGVFIVEVDGVRVVHLGDLGHVLTKEQVDKIGRVDVLLVPVGGVYTINGSEAKKVVAQLKPTMYVVPMHHGTKVFDDVLAVDEFLEDQNRQYIRRLDMGQTSNE